MKKSKEEEKHTEKLFTVSKFIFIIFIIIVVTQFVGCSYPIEKEIVGKWTVTGQPGFVQFLANKSVVLTDGKEEYTGTWRLDKNRLLLQFKVRGSTTIIWDNVKIHGDTMTVTSWGIETNFIRSK